MALPAGEWGRELATDARGQVWSAGSRVLRYRPRDTAWDVADDSGPSSGTIIADANGVAWTIDDSGEVQRVEDLAGALTTDVVTTGTGGTGITVDHDGLVWAIGTVDDGLVSVIDPVRPGQVTGTFCPFLQRSYARGDLTGAPRFGVLEPVTWTGRIDAPARDCAITWRLLDVVGSIGDGVGIVAEVRAGASAEELDAAAWIAVGQVPPATLPVDIGPALQGAGQEGRLLDVRLTIDPVDHDDLPVIDAVTAERIEFCL